LGIMQLQFGGHTLQFGYPSLFFVLFFASLGMTQYA
jgi:hypothetical protein